jgi:hypothetical protein
VQRWLAEAEEEGTAPERYVDADVDDSSWQPVVAGAWAYQLPAEPVRKWPIPVWYRIPFDVDEVPPDLRLLVDGFKGVQPQVVLNGERVEWKPRRSAVDAEMKELDLPPARRGRNVLAVRLVLEGPTGGLVDHVKLLGSFRLAGDEQTGFRIAAASPEIEPASWTEQGFPFYSGRGVYRTRVDVPAELTGQSASVEIPMRDDVVEVEVNEAAAGVRLWDPYAVDVTGLLRSGPNDLAFRVANTPANLLNGTPRTSGIAGAPRLVFGAASA